MKEKCKKQQKKDKQTQKGARKTEAIVNGWKLNDFVMRLFILFDMLLNTSFKMTTSFANVAGTTASTTKFIY